MTRMREINEQIRQAYDHRQQEAERRRDARVAELWRLHPELARCEAAIERCGLELLQQSLQPDGPGDQEAALEQLMTARRQLLLELGLDETYDQIVPFCPSCRDTGRVGEQLCSCFRTLELNYLADVANLKPLQQFRFEKFDLDYFSDQADPQRYRVNWSPRRNMIGLRDMALNFCKAFGRSPVRSLYFFGQPGTGKTFLMGCIANELTDRGFRVIYLTAQRLFDLLAQYRVLLASFRRDEAAFEEAAALVEAIKGCDLLLLDDLGTERASGASYTDLLELLNQRAAEALPLIISSNITVKDLSLSYDERIKSRLIGQFDLYPFFGEDVRRVQAELRNRRTS